MTHLRLLSILIVAAACGGGSGSPTGPNNDPGPSPPPGGQNPPASAQVQMRSDGEYGVEAHSFVPTSVTIARNGTVTWTNSTGFVHNVTFAGQGAPSNVADFASGSRDRTFSNTGTFQYQCTLHAGMNGQVVVQ